MRPQHCARPNDAYTWEPAQRKREKHMDLLHSLRDWNLHFMGIPDIIAGCCVLVLIGIGITQAPERVRSRIAIALFLLVGSVVGWVLGAAYLSGEGWPPKWWHW
jgi:hypothetical protein